jgi:hypothetical protein
MVPWVGTEWREEKGREEKGREEKGSTPLTSRLDIEHI